MLKSVGLAVLGFLQDGTCATIIFALDQTGTPGMKNSNGMHLPGSGTLDVIFFTKSNAVKKMPNWRSLASAPSFMFDPGMFLQS